MAVEWGLSLTAGPEKNKIDEWLAGYDRAAERFKGHFSSLWVTDHFFWEDEPTYEAWTVIAYIAARYPDYDVGPMVLGQSYRNPALTAKMAATLHALTGGRYIHAIGAGWKEDEYHAYGYEYPRPGVRVAQLEDALEITTRLWHEPGKVTYEGKHYSVRDAWCEPKPDPAPTLIVGGGGKKTMMLAARFADWWSIPDANLESFKERLAILEQHCDTIGRDYASLRKTWFGRLAVGKTEAEAQRIAGRWTTEQIGRASCRERV
jgi:alkanesulfonate monooxygenase SsuD/methylene tetrahydromethanopterin reductase-like flavin-dependent oxidoreductase (luciferase family)